jgi:hypothetical protein
MKMINLPAVVIGEGSYNLMGICVAISLQIAEMPVDATNSPKTVRKDHNVSFYQNMK